MQKFPRASFVTDALRKLAGFSGSPNHWLPKDFWHPTQELKMGVRGKIIWAVMHRLDQPTSWSSCPQIPYTSLKLKLYCLLPERFEEGAGFIQRKSKSSQIDIFYFCKHHEFQWASYTGGARSGFELDRWNNEKLLQKMNGDSRKKRPEKTKWVEKTMLGRASFAKHYYFFFNLYSIRTD